MSYLESEDLEGLQRHPKRRKAEYNHIKQLDFYGLGDSEEEFRIRYRFKKNTIRVLCELLGQEFAPKSGANNAFTVEQRLCIALRYYATGTFQRQIGDSEGASQSSTHRIIKKVSKVLASHAPDVIQFSTDPEIFKVVSDGFYGFKGKLPMCVGAIDGTQIPIKAPWQNPEQYKNYHKYHSIATMVVVNHRGALTYVSAHWPGSLHDSRVLQETFLQDVLDRNLLGEYYLIGDQGYHLQQNLLTPFPRGSDLTQPQIYYNDCLSKTRVKVECVIGMMKKKFACLTIASHYQPDEVCDVIKACCFLWNYGLLTGDNKGYDPDTYVVTDKEELAGKLKPTISGETRREIVKEYLWDNK